MKLVKGPYSWPEMQAIFLRVLIMFGDMACVAFGYILAFYVRFSFHAFQNVFPIIKGTPPITEYLKTMPTLLVVWALSIYWLRGYDRIQLPALDDAIRILRCSFMGTVLAMTAMFLYRESSYSRLVFGFGGLFSFVFIYIYREIIKTLYLFWVRAQGKPRRVLILGNGYLANALDKILKSQRDRAVIKSSSSQVEPIEKTIKRLRIAEVLLINKKIEHAEVVRLSTFCEERGIKFRLLPDILEIRMGELVIDESLGLPTFKLKSVSLHGTSFLAKRIFDVMISSIILGMGFVPLFFIAFLIRLNSKGAIFYSQDRMGYKGTTFKFMKFRTMVSNADDLLDNLKKQSDRLGPVFKMKNDPRVTSIGQFLRRYSLDEIPQLLNVLSGDMSLVGPRPQVLWEAKAYDEWARKRLNVLPGITGLWQVSGRAELTYEEMIDLDIFYIENWSAGLDIKILLKTLPAVLGGKGAY